MRTKLLGLSLLVLMLVAGAIGISRDSRRSVRPFVDRAALVTPSRFEPAQSAGFFCGIPRFPQNRELADVQFAADDAVDLAYTFSMENNDLLRPSRVTIALSGNPSKGESKERLRRLKAAGARIVMNITGDDVRQLLTEQAALAGRGGVFIVSFATHGFHSGGIPYLLAPDSKFLDVESSISVPDVAEIAGSSAARSLIFLDACRERVSSVTRAGLREPRSAAIFLDRLTKIEGQVIFSAAPPGGYAYDDPDRGNGVFTAAVIDSLQCEGTQREWVTVDSLAKGVERTVLRFLKKHDPSLKKATQLSTEGSTGSMPLARCRPRPEPIALVDRVEARGPAIVAFDADGRSLWTKQLDGNVRDTYVGQLFKEKTNYVVVLAEERGDAARVTIFDGAGNLFADYPHNGPLRHMKVERPTPSHNPRILLGGTRRNIAAQLGVIGAVPTVLQLWPRNTGALSEEWYLPIGLPGHAITGIRVEGEGKKRTIIVTTSRGKAVRVTFKGKIVD
jgi:hypothetical protein